VYGNAWAMAWVVHQATRSPLELFDANRFYPRPSSFAAGLALDCIAEWT
jgi:hypothetical protein